MDNIKLAIHNLQDSISAENRREKDVENSLMQLHSTANLLKLSTIPPNTFKRISELLRQRLLPLYQISLTRALQYSTVVLEFIHDEKLIPTLKAKNEPLKQLWERLLTSLVSGVLDYLDQSPDIQSRESIATVFYPTLTRIYFSPLALFLSEINGGLLSAVYQLLVTTVEPQARNAARLRDHGISSKCLGLTLSQIRGTFYYFLAIESLLDIICTLIPPVKNGVEKRSQFIKEVFDPDLFQCSKPILQILESITDGDWSITAVKIIEVLASSDISFPQPFNASSLMICGISVNAIAPFYVDKNGFLANLDQDGKLETLYVPFRTVTRIVGSSISYIEFSIVLVLSMPPIIGTEPLSVPSGRGLSVSWNLKKSQLGKFANVAKDRNLTFLNLTTRKLSLPGTHIAFNLPADKEPQELVSTKEKIHDMAKLLAMPSSPEFDRTEPNSPINQQPGSREHKAENTPPSAELVTEIVEDNAAHQTVFLDLNGNLSFTDPYPVNKAFIQPLGDNTLLAVSSISELPRRPAQRFTKIQENNTAITSRVTRSNIIAPPTVPKPSNGKPKKKSATTKKSPAVKRRPNQTTASDVQLHSRILSQGHSAVSIDVDKLPESKVTIPPSKAQKRCSATAGTMDTAVTKPLDEPRQHEDRSLETNISPVDLKPENKKRPIRNIEESEGIHVAEQDRPNKRTRMDLEKPSHPALSYQRKKYGRNGRTSSPRGESPAIPIVDFDEIPDPKHSGVVERPNSRAMNGKRSGKKTESKPAAPKKRKQEPRDVRLVIKPTAPKVPVSLARPKRDNQARESLSEIDHHPVEQETTTGPEMKLDCHSTTLTKTPSITQAIKTEDRNENNARKEAQTAPWGDKNFLQKVEGALKPICSPPTKEILAQKDETRDLDHSLTLVVDDDDYEQEKEVVEPSTFEPDIDMIDLTAQDDPPIPARIPINVFSKSSLKEDKPVANVQPALHEKQTQKVKVEMSLPHHLPAKDRHNRPSVSFALPVESQRYPWPETSTFAQKQRTYLASKYHKIHKSWEKSDLNKTTSRTVHQRGYPKAEEKKYEEPEEPIERIAKIIKQIGETVVHQISRRFDSVRDELHAGHRSILQGTLQHLERMHEESTAHLANMVELEEEYALRCGNILKGFDDIRESSNNLASCVKNIVKEHNQQSLSKKFPPKLFDKRTGILLNATIGSNRLD